MPINTISIIIMNENKLEFSSVMFICLYVIIRNFIFYVLDVLFFLSSLSASASIFSLFALLNAISSSI